MLLAILLARTPSQTGRQYSTPIIVPGGHHNKGGDFKVFSDVKQDNLENPTIIKGQDVGDGPVPVFD
jgi:hypothetical protein